MNVADYDYPLPEELIAAYPLKRGNSRMMLLNRNDGHIEHRHFAEITDLLHENSLIVRNVTSVVKTRIFAQRKTGAEIELLILNPYIKGRTFSALIKRGGRLKEHEKLYAGDAVIHINSRVDEVFSVTIDSEGDIESFFEGYGHVPLPPYIKRPDEDDDRKTYQTVYSSKRGSSAAPTAGLHFSNEIIQKLQQRGIEFADITLHVGLGTFEPVKAMRIEEHKMHAEYYDITKSAAEQLNRARAEGKHIIAVGTTSLRVLETVFEDGHYSAGSGMTDIFIYPPYKISSADMLLTNFHLPKSTLLMLVSAFAGREHIMNAYREAVDKKYRFYSYGDCMLIG